MQILFITTYLVFSANLQKLLDTSVSVNGYIKINRSYKFYVFLFSFYCPGKNKVVGRRLRKKLQH